jgi:hypothetical protein
MIRGGIIFLFIFSTLSLSAQEMTDEEFEEIAGRIFMPSLDVGYIHPNSDIMQGAYIVKTTLEYRISNNNDYFIRLSYDTYGSRYQLPGNASGFNTIEGTVQVQDIFLAPGYRWGDQKYRIMVALMPGIKIYEYPTASINNQNIQLKQEGRRLFTTSILTTLEYYFDEKSALAVSLYQNQVWKPVDFWSEGASAFGISIGLITSLL